MNARAAFASHMRRPRTATSSASPAIALPTIVATMISMLTTMPCRNGSRS
jgi:hypothetical protein